MTVELSQAAGPGLRATHTLVSSRSDVVGIVAEHDFVDVALAALVEKMGFRAAVIDLDAGGEIAEPIVAVVRSAHRLIRIRNERSLRETIIIGIGEDFPPGGAVKRISSTDMGSDLQRTLAAAASRNPDLRTRVRLSEREREILETYALGATLRETCRKHFVAEGTVREHYRRVKHRYDEAGRPVANKTQLLLQLIADGWVQPA